MDFVAKFFKVLSGAALAASFALVSSASADATYLKLEGGYGQVHNDLSGTITTIALPDPAYSINAPQYGIGIGYKYGDVRTDLTLSTAVGTKTKVQGALVGVKLRDRTTSLMLNVAYDLNQGAMLTPYVSAGIGGKRIQTKVTDVGHTQDYALKNQNALAVQGGVGVLMQYENIALDLGVRVGTAFVKSSSKSTVFGADTLTMKRKYDVNAMLGLVFMF